MPVSYLAQSSLNRFQRPWYRQRRFYIPAAIVAGLLVIGGIYWAFLAADLSRQAETFDLTKLEQMESASVILDRNDKIFGQIYVENREAIPYDQIPRDLVNAVVAIEDNKFYQHGGYDLWGIIRAALKNFTAGHVRQGASTVTQQLARNSFALKERTFRRKLLEIYLARRIETTFSKQKIMELYLNRIYFGGGMYGAQAAAHGYFGKAAREMSLVECATLAGLIKSPNRLSPWTDRAASREARNVVLAKMRDLGFITAERSDAAQTQDVLIGSRQNAQGQTYAVDYIRQQVIAAVGWDRAMNEGFRIHTTVDADLQRVAENSLRAHLDQAEQHPGYDHLTYAQYVERYHKGRPATGTPAPAAAPEYLQGAVVALDNATGGVLVLIGGRDFEHNQFDRALQARRPAGTAITPFVFAAAFEKGLYPGTVVEDSALDNRTVMIGGTTGILGEWGPESAENRYEGPITARQALAKSKNGATVRLGLNPGVESVVQLCKAAGMKSPMRPYPATFLGSSEVTLAELAIAYTIFPNGGWRPDAIHILDRIDDKDGHVVWQAAPEKERKDVIKPETAFEVHSCLVEALTNGTASAARTKFGLKDFPAAGKTGTAYDFTDVLFAGYDSGMTCAVWAGFDKPQKIYRGAFGNQIALPVWVDIMNASTERYAPREIPTPAIVKTVEICARSGALATDKCFDTVKTASGETKEVSTVYRELATPAQMPTAPCPIHGELRARLARDLPSSGFPRASLAVNNAEVTPVPLRGQVLLAELDPYSAVRSTVKPKVAPLAERIAPEAPVSAVPLPTASPASSAGTIVDPSPGTGETATSGAAQQILKAVPVRPIQPRSAFGAPWQSSVPQRQPTPVPQSPAQIQNGRPLEIRRARPVRTPADEESATPVLRARPLVTPDEDNN